MTLEKTVSEILKRDVSIDEAKQFASDQFGLIFTYLREKHREKETRVFVLDASELPEDSTTSAHDIQNWLSYEEIHGKITSEAEDFIKLCEERGTTYSLYGFHEAFNFGYIGANDYIYITNKY
jgi:hypothetical protein